MTTLFRARLAGALCLAALAAPGCASEPARDVRPASEPSAPVASAADAGSTPVDADAWTGWPNLSQEGQVLFAGQPTREGLEEARRRGAKTVINLRTAEEMQSQVAFDERAAAEALGLRYVQVPVTPATFTPETAARFAEALEGAERPVVVHCSTSNRVGGLWAAYLHLERGVPAEEALARGRAAGLSHPKMVEATEGVLRAGPAVKDDPPRR